MKNYLIAGGTSGIGLELALQLAAEGNRIHVLARNVPNFSLPENISFQIWDATGESLPVISFENIDGLVYTPGSINLKPFHRISETEFSEEFKLNALGAVKLMQHVLPQLKKSGNASVVLFSTVAVKTGMPFHSSIAMAKGAIEGLTRSLAAEWAPTIRVNAIAPSLTNTPLAGKLLSTPEKFAASEKRHPLGKIGNPSEIAALAKFLLKEESSWITGQVITADGGIGNLRLL